MSPIICLATLVAFTIACWIPLGFILTGEDRYRRLRVPDPIDPDPVPLVYNDHIGFIV